MKPNPRGNTVRALFSFLGSTLVGFYFKLSLISPQHSLYPWTEQRKTEQSIRRASVQKKKKSEWKAHRSSLQGECIFRSTKGKRSVILALGPAWEGSFNAGQRDYHIDPSRLTWGAWLLLRLLFLWVLRRCALIDRYWPKILVMTAQLGIESEKMGSCFASHLKYNLLFDLPDWTIQPAKFHGLIR